MMAALEKSPLKKRWGHGNKQRYKDTKRGGKTVLVHRLVMEQYLGRKLLTAEHIHHINSDKRDNRIENLQIVSNSEHQKMELAEFKNKHPELFK